MPWSRCEIRFFNEETSQAQAQFACTTGTSWSVMWHRTFSSRSLSCCHTGAWQEQLETTKVVFSPEAHARSTFASSRAHGRYPATPDARPRSKKVFSKSSQSAGRRALQATTAHPRPKDLQHSADGPCHRKSRQTDLDHAIGVALPSRSKFETA